MQPFDLAESVSSKRDFLGVWWTEGDLATGIGRYRDSRADSDLRAPADDGSFRVARDPGGRHHAPISETCFGKVDNLQLSAKRPAASLSDRPKRICRPGRPGSYVGGSTPVVVHS